MLKVASSHEFFNGCMQPYSSNPTFSKILAVYVGNQMMLEEVDDQEEAEERISNTNWDFYHKFTDSSFFF